MKKATPSDVFVCYAYEARFLGELVVQSLEDRGLPIYRPWIADQSEKIHEDDVREVVRRLRAVVGVHLVGRDVEPLLLIAIGAARERKVPVFVITDEEWPDAP